MPGGNSIFIIVLIVLMAAMMWWSSHKQKQQQNQVKDFRSSLQPGQLVQTIGGIIGSVVSVDEKYEEIVIDSEGSKLRFTFRAINKTYERPAFIDDDEVDEDGNPINPEEENASSEAPQDAAGESSARDDNEAQKPFDDNAESEEDSVENAEDPESTPESPSQSADEHDGGEDSKQ
ncbi:preprotein translocase subunit YajC [Bifidobacterium sp. ESL0775]|uniref:preprotein translocase subunit YajC n=1 Tax=Bifidobacterium sp. ESL0775 TaxID=2983230 RepID=UPI0023F71959|nr:preprotein translocase subunit YajC [Bifidobacterium sp. ESL0775]WEV68565.1 preprotein translocase subunit YajC [Bifidobacterium sp. ESL0775]